MTMVARLLAQLCGMAAWGFTLLRPERFRPLSLRGTALSTSVFQYFLPTARPLNIAPLPEEMGWILPHLSSRIRMEIFMSLERLVPQIFRSPPELMMEHSMVAQPKIWQVVASFQGTSEMVQISSS